MLTTWMSESVAVLVTVRLASPTIVRLVCAGSTGALFRSLTTTVKLFVALRVGLPLSLTTVVITLVEGACAWVGVQVIMPLALIAALDGPLTSAYASVNGGMSDSLAVLVTSSSVSSLIVKLVWAGRTGGLWTACTTTVKLLVALRFTALAAWGS